MAAPGIESRLVDGVFRVTLNRPPLNILDSRMLEDLAHGLPPGVWLSAFNAQAATPGRTPTGGAAPGGTVSFTATGLDYPAVGPEHALLHDEGRVEYSWAQDDEALDAFRRLSRQEGIIPALESSHAVAWVVREAATLRDQVVLVNLSGRGDKDLGILEQIEK